MRLIQKINIILKEDKLKIKIINKILKMVNMRKIKIIMVLMKIIKILISLLMKRMMMLLFIKNWLLQKLQGNEQKKI